MNKLTLESILECAAGLREAMKNSKPSYCANTMPRQNDYESGRNVPNDSLNPDVKFRPSRLL